MDVPAAIEFLLAEGARLDARQAKFDRQLHALARLGVRAFNHLNQAQHRTEEALDRLATQQCETQANLNALILLFEPNVSGNGGPAPHPK